MTYGEIALGVECALPYLRRERRRAAVAQWLKRLATVLKRRG